MIFTAHVTTQDPLVLCEMVAYIIILLWQVISCTDSCFNLLVFQQWIWVGCTHLLFRTHLERRPVCKTLLQNAIHKLQRTHSLTHPHHHYRGWVRYPHSWWAWHHYTSSHVYSPSWSSLTVLVPEPPLHCWIACTIQYWASIHSTHGTLHTLYAWPAQAKAIGEYFFMHAYQTIQ